MVLNLGRPARFRCPPGISFEHGCVLQCGFLTATVARPSLPSTGRPAVVRIGMGSRLHHDTRVSAILLQRYPYTWTTLFFSSCLRRAFLAFMSVLLIWLCIWTDSLLRTRMDHVCSVDTNCYRSFHLDSYLDVSIPCLVRIVFFHRVQDPPGTSALACVSSDPGDDCIRATVFDRYPVLVHRTVQHLLQPRLISS